MAGVSAYNKKYAIRDLESKDAAQDIDGNFDHIYKDVRYLADLINALSQSVAVIQQTTTTPASLSVPAYGDEGDEGPMGPPGIPGADGASDLIFVSPGVDVPVNATTDVTIVTHDVSDIVADDKLIIEGWFTILNNSSASRVYTVTLDFDNVFDLEITTPSLAASASTLHPFKLRGVLDVRSASLAYEVVDLNGTMASEST
jgi:hypothetical protein